MTTQSIEQLARECAAVLHNEMSKLKGPWLVSENSFLPANVECDYGGQQNFRGILAKTLSQYLITAHANGMKETAELLKKRLLNGEYNAIMSVETEACMDIILAAAKEGAK